MSGSSSVAAASPGLSSPSIDDYIDSHGSRTRLAQKHMEPSREEWYGQANHARNRPRDRRSAHPPGSPKQEEHRRQSEWRCIILDAAGNVLVSALVSAKGNESLVLRRCTLRRI